MKFCKTRWVENVVVAKRFLLVFDEVNKFVEGDPHS